MNESPLLELRYEGGTVLIHGDDPTLYAQLPHVRFDERSGSGRAEGRRYRAIVEYLRAHKIAYSDQARAWNETRWSIANQRTPFPHQTEAVDSWWRSRGQGVVVLPTGTGKTYVAILAIARTARPALVITPTLDLLNQWYGELLAAFGAPIGLIGGGHYDLQPITVSTYDSAYIHADRWANRYGLLVFDECHHLPGPSYSLAATGSLAPFRLGLTATPERADGQDIAYSDLIGPIIYRREIKELSGEFLADYQTRRLLVPLTEQEQSEYNSARKIYREYIEQHGISLGGANGWRRFIFEASRTKEGWAAYQAYKTYKKLERSAAGKMVVLAELLHKHAQDRAIIFTADNATVYQIAREFLIPAITHQTKTRERSLVLDRFRCGEYSAVVTSQVLNEGVDVPEANVGIVLSGTSTIRENVQRLGRLLRKKGAKQAILYEIVASGTMEEFSSERRRQHTAFE